MLPANLGSVVIRHLEQADHVAYVALEKDAAVKQYLGGPTAKTEQQLLGDLRGYQPSTEILAMADAATGQFIGRCGLLPIRDTLEEEIYCVLAKDYWGRGIGELVVAFLARLAIARGKTAVGIVHPDNTKSFRLLEKLGWVQAGTVSEPGKKLGHLRYVPSSV